MKKLTLLAIAALAMTFASCKKDYKCQCTYSNIGNGYNSNSVSTITIHNTKSKASTTCSAFNYNYVSGGHTETQSCVIQ